MIRLFISFFSISSVPRYECGILWYGASSGLRLQVPAVNPFFHLWRLVKRVPIFQYKIHSVLAELFSQAADRVCMFGSGVVDRTEKLRSLLGRQCRKSDLLRQNQE